MINVSSLFMTHGMVEVCPCDFRMFHCKSLHELGTEMYSLSKEAPAIAPWSS